MNFFSFKHIIFLLPVLLIGIVTAPSVRSEVQPTTIEIVFDGSGSMSSWLYTQPKIDIARDALDETLAEIDPTVEIGLRAYGLVREDCTSSELLVDFGPDQHQAVVESVADLEPTGMTPLAYSIQRAAEDLADKTGKRKIIVLGDGQETCAGDLAAAGQELQDAGIDIDTIYIGGSDQESESLQQLADAGNGNFFEALTGEELREALRSAFSDLPTADVKNPNTSTAETIPAESLEQFQQVCSTPAKVGDHVLYQEFDIVDTQQESTASTGLEVVFDASGSMAGQVDGRAKIDIAREALATALQELDPNVAVAFRAYGHRVPQSDQANSCQDTELILPFSEETADDDSATAVQQAASGLTATGWTPIDLSLRQAAADLKEFDRKVVLLLSDGEETCNGDPVAALQELATQDVVVTVHTVGFDVDAATAEQLRRISESTGGSYVDAQNEEQLQQGLTYVVAETEKTENQCPTLFSNPIAGGDSFDTAVVIEPGTYTLDRHLESGEHYYFKLPVKSGQVVTLYGVASRPSITGNKDAGYVEQHNGTFSVFDVVPYNTDREEINNKNFRPTNAQPEKNVPIAVLEDGDLYVDIGYDISDVHKDSIFSIQVSDHFDADTGSDVSGDVSDDGPSDEPGALSFEQLAQGVIGGLGLEDTQDRYTIVDSADLEINTITVKFANETFKAQLDVLNANGDLKDRVTDVGEFSLALEEPLVAGDQLLLIDRTIGSDLLHTDYTMSTVLGSAEEPINGSADDAAGVVGQNNAGQSASETGSLFSNVNRTTWLVGFAILLVLIGMGVVIGVVIYTKKKRKNN